MTPAEIRDLRIRLRLTQAEFGRRLGLTGKDTTRGRMVSRWEAGPANGGRTLPAKHELAILRGALDAPAK